MASRFEFKQSNKRLWGRLEVNYAREMSSSDQHRRQSSQPRSERGANQTNIKQPLQFKRPPAGTQPPNAASKTSVSMTMRRVSSARMQNNSVSESLQQFMVSRSNSAARSSHGNLSQNEENAEESQIHKEALQPRQTVDLQQDHGQGDEQCTRKSSSVERVEKYLRRDTSKQMRTYQAQSDRDTASLNKPPRSTSQAANKQVRFDIKEGLRGMIKESAPAFDAANYHRQLMEKKRQKQSSSLSQEENQLCVSAGSHRHNSDHMQASRREMTQTLTKVSPVFGGKKVQKRKSSSVKKSTDKKGVNSTIISQSSGRRYQEVISPTSSSSKKFAYNLALKYQKEVLESKVKKGEINLRKLKVEDTDATPKSSRLQPPKPVQMTNVIPEVLDERYLQCDEMRQSQTIPAHLTTVTNSLEEGTRDERQNRQSASSVRKAGQILRIRSISPKEVSQAERVANDDQSAMLTQEDETLTPTGMRNRRYNQENHSMNRTFYAGQIVRNQKRPSQGRKSSRSNHQIGCSSETLSISYQAQLQPITIQNERIGASEAQSPSVGAILHQNMTRILGESQLESVMPPVSSSQEPEMQAHLSHPSIILQQAPDGGIFQPEELHEQSSEPSHLHESAHFPCPTNMNNDLYESVQASSVKEPVRTMASLWDFFLISETDFHRLTPAFSQQVELSKQALHEPLRQDDQAAGLSSARLASQGLRVPDHRLHLIRVHLRNVLLDSFLPLILEIIQLRDRLAYRKHTFRLAIKQPLKASIISDICSRLKQKLVLKVLFLQSQFRKNLHSLFSAYLDLLVKKQIVRASFDHLRTFKQRRVEKTAYLDYAKAQLCELRKVQVLDCMRRYGPLLRLQAEKSLQSAKILAWRKATRVVLAWKASVVARRVSQIGHEMTVRFRTMKLRHQLFAKWLNANRVDRRIKAKALRMFNNGQDERRGLPDCESELASEQSTTTLEGQAQGEAWMQAVKARSEEIFYRQTQELLLEKEHHLTIIKRIYGKMKAQELDLVVPCSFDRSLNPGVWKIRPSQALLSNKEQIYTQYPELQKATMTAIPARLVDQSIIVAATLPHGIQLQKSVSELNKALVPPIQKFMVSNDAPDRIISEQHTVLSTKYSVHEALVAQQNMFGLKNDTYQMKMQSGEKTSYQNQSESFVQQAVGNTFESVSESIAPSQMVLVESHGVRAVPFKRQTSIAPPTYQSQSINEKRAPNQLFMKLKQQNEAAQHQPLPLKAPASRPSHAKYQQSRLPPEVQLHAHFRNMLQLYRQCLQRQSEGRNHTIRAKSMALALREVTQDGEPAFIPSEGMSLTDFTQVAMQSGLSLLHLNDVQMRYRFVEAWRQRLVLRLLEKDLDQYRGFQAGRAALRKWTLHIQKQKLRAQNHWRTKQMHRFYSLFTRWAKANRQLVYETERQVRHFKARYTLTRWRNYYQRVGRRHRVERAAIEFYVRSLLARALATLCQNRRRLLNCKRFEKRKVLLKFFKRRWLPKCRSRMLLRSVLERCIERDQDQDRPRYQRQFDLLKGAMNTWRKRVEERLMLYKTYMALNHYRITLVSKSFRAIRADPIKAQAAHQLVNTLLDVALQNPFYQMLRVCADQNFKARELKVSRQTYICRQFFAHLHAMTVKTKLARLFVQRKYLKALQTYIFKHNYVRPLAFREHQLSKRALNAWKSSKGHRWKRQRLEIVYRALLHRKRKNVLSQVMGCLKEHALAERRERIINCTVADFRRHTLLEKSFKLLKFYQIKRHKQELLGQVASEFHEERLRMKIEAGRTNVQLNMQTGCLLNANQALLLTVLTEWRFMSNCLKQHKAKLENKIKTRSQMLILRCFLAWRSFARYEQSEISGLDGGNTRSAISYLDVIDDLASNNLTQDNGEARRHSSLAYEQNSMTKVVAVAHRQTPTISYINTDNESARTGQQLSQLGERPIQTAQVCSQSSIATSLVNSSSKNQTRGSVNTKMSLGQIRGGNSRQNMCNPSLTIENSESTLNARAMPLNHLRSSSQLKHTRNDVNSVLLSNQSSSQLNQRQHNHGREHESAGQIAMPRNHQHHSSVPDYAALGGAGATTDGVSVGYTPGMYQDTSEFASRFEEEVAKTAGNGTGSIASFNQHVGRGHHQHGFSAGEDATDLSPQEYLSMNDIEGREEDQFSYEQVIAQGDNMSDPSKKGEPTLVTTLAPYNYSIDLPFKQASAKHTCKKSMQQLHNHSKKSGQQSVQQHKRYDSGPMTTAVREEDYATFSIQECQQAIQPALQEQSRHQYRQRVFSSSNEDQDQDDSSVESGDGYQPMRQAPEQHNYMVDHYQSAGRDLRDSAASSDAYACREMQGRDKSPSQSSLALQANDALQEQNEEARLATLEQQQNVAHLKGHLGSLTISNGTGKQLYEELESIYRNEDELMEEQAEREALLREMASHYQTRLTSTLDNKADSVLHEQESKHLDSYHAPGHHLTGSLSLQEEPAESQDVTSHMDSALQQSRQSQGLVKYAPDCFVESQNSSSQVVSGYYMSASFAAGDSQHERYDEQSCTHYYIGDKDNHCGKERFSYADGEDYGSEEGITQEDEVVSVNNPMDSHIHN